VLVTFLLINVPACLFNAFPMVYLCESLNSAGPLAVSIVLQVVTTILMFITSAMDPGVIPTNYFDHIAASGIHPKYCNVLTKSQRVFFLNVSHYNPSSVTPNIYRLKFCETCLIFRP
jgi:palmitoyltransferase ZDHHC9/14/18